MTKTAAPLIGHRLDLSRRPFELVLLLVVLITVIRVVGLFNTPIELYPEEAQYWVWSRHLAFGYFSKPPMIAWLIAATTALGGDSEPWVRLSAPLAHGLAALALQRVGARLYNGWTGFWAGAIYSLMPGVQLSSGVIATDAPMLLFVCLALWGYAGFVTARRRAEAMWCVTGMGVALGLGGLSKYAALYLVAGLVLHAAVDGRARRRWRSPELTLFLATTLLVLAPNLIWNLRHGFETVAHTAADADFSPTQVKGVEPGGSFDPRQAPGFILSQFGVFGPIPFAVLIGGAIALIRRRKRAAEDVMLLTLAAPPLAIITAVAVIARANANWAAAAYCSAAVLVAAWLVRWRAWRLLGLAIGSQTLLAAVFVMAAVSPTFADRAGFANSFKRARGWRETTDVAMAELARASHEGHVSALAVDDRFLFNALAYYGRDELRRRGAPPLVMWVREAKPHNEAETVAPLLALQGSDVLFVSVKTAYRTEAMHDFKAVQSLADRFVQLDPKHAREIFVFSGRGYSRRPRNAAGLPIPIGGPPPNASRATAKRPTADNAQATAGHLQHRS